MLCSSRAEGEEGDISHRQKGLGNVTGYLEDVTYNSLGQHRARGRHHLIAGESHASETSEATECGEQGNVLVMGQQHFQKPAPGHPVDWRDICLQVKNNWLEDLGSSSVKLTDEQELRELNFRLVNCQTELGIDKTQSNKATEKQP